MKAVGRIIKIVFVFLVSLAVISFIWYKIETNNPNNSSDAIPFIDYVLYLLGYGEVNIENHYSKTFFSVLSLFVLTLLSSVFTVNLFELKAKVKVSSNLLIWNKQNVHHFASTVVESNGKDIYNMKITLILSDGNKVKTEEKYIPFIPKKSSRVIDFKIAPGTVCYEYLRNNLKGSASLPVLLATVTYTDIDSGQEYTICKKYAMNKGIVFAPNTSTIDDYSNVSCRAFNKINVADIENENLTKAYINNNTFKIDLKQAKPINAKDIDLSFGYSFDKPEKIFFSADKAFSADVHINSRSDYAFEDFTMICISRPLDGNWSAYYDLGCCLTFDCMVEGDMLLTMEFKYFDSKTNTLNNFTQNFSNKNGFEKYTLDLRKFKREDLCNVHELCFTVFYKNVNPENPTGKFTIINCMLEV